MAFAILRWACLALLVLALPAAASDRVTVFAAASLKTALDAIKADHGGDITLSYAGSSALARQIERGAPADIFISANAAWMDALDAQGHIVGGSRRDLLGNRLVLVASEPVSGNPGALIGSSRLAMALVDAVPAGIYGRAALTHLGLWDRLGGQVVQTDNVRAALALVALGEVPFGIVYATDAAAEPRVHVAHVFGAATHPPITYPAALLRDGAAARDFLDHLSGPKAQAIFAAHGFLPPPEPRP
jgi:molybdate transport system substrate-binding protein